MFSIILVTHFELGTALLRSTREILGKLPVPTLLLNVDNSSTPDKIRAEATKLLTKIAKEMPVLFLTDLCGSTPHNVLTDKEYIAESLSCDHTIEVLSGVNLPMLLRVFNYHYLPFEEVINKAIEGAHNGIVSHTVPSN